MHHPGPFCRVMTLTFADQGSVWSAVPCTSPDVAMSATIWFALIAPITPDHEKRRS